MVLSVPARRVVGSPDLLLKRAALSFSPVRGVKHRNRQRQPLPAPLVFAVVEGETGLQRARLPNVEDAIPLILLKAEDRVDAPLLPNLVQISEGALE